MAEDRAQSNVFREIASGLGESGFGFRFRAVGRSMLPTIEDGEIVCVQPIETRRIRVGDIVLFREGSGFKAHRVVRRKGISFVTRGDAGMEADGAIRGEEIVGKIVAKECGTTGQEIQLDGFASRLKFFTNEAKRLAMRHLSVRSVPLLALAITLILSSLPTHAQVAVNASSNGAARLARGGSLTFSHTPVTGGSNYVLVVGVSMNISGKNTTTVGGVTYNGTALTLAGACNNTPAACNSNNAGITDNDRRTEIWYLINPTHDGNAHNVVVTINVPSGGNPTIGTVAGAVTFTGADQATPIRSYVAFDGSSDTTRLDIPSAINDVVLDTLAFDGNRAVNTVSGTQAQQWTNTSWPGSGGSGSDVRGFGSTRAGAPSVPMSESLSGSSHWSDSGVSIQPFQGDLSVSVSGNTTQFPANVSYTVTVSNSGPSASSGVVLTDTLANGVTLVSATPSQGSCTGTTTITCNLGTIAISGTATVTITALPSAPGGYVNNASVTATTPDLNSDNNSATGVAYSELTACVIGTTTTNTNVSGVINTYYPGTATVNAGSTSVTLGAATGAGVPIASGDLVLVIQMQDATINTSNSIAYGDGFGGTGSTSLNNAGVYEYANATSAVPTSGGTLTLTAAGPNGGLLYTYTSTAASSTQGARTFQVIRVPNYASATLSSTTPPAASAWNGSTGGVLALDVSGVLTLNSTTIDVTGLGFRGGAGLQLTGSATGATSSDYLYTAPTTYTGSRTGADGSKGEGIAGTPHWVESGSTSLNTNQSYAEGYPLGSMARGAPGNAGGGGTDGDPATASTAGNDENSGGGGGANGGAGGQGGDSWNSNLTNGGIGGTTFPASISRVVMGGGGGAGSRNNDPTKAQASSGAAGGGIVMIRAGSLSGTATIHADGSAAYNATDNDGGGGGGAGGSIILLWGSGVGTGLTLTAQGGRGGDAWDTQAYSAGNRHGPGGGGGGGVILVSGAANSASVSGGANGVTLNTPSVAYGATSGSSGFTSTNVSSISSPGPHSASICTDVGITKVGTPDPVLQNATLTYTLTVTNNGPQAAATVTVVDTLPAEVTYVSVSSSPSTWICSQASGVVTCTLAGMPSGDVETITIVTTATTPALALNTAVVNSVTADPALGNNTATFTSTIEFPTAVRLNSLAATNAPNGVLITWNTAGEVHNLGFNVYREVAGQKVRINPSLIAGSALLMRDTVEQHGAKTYGWMDSSPASSGLYWLEDLDLNGTRTLHGPVQIEQQGTTPSASRTITVQTSARITSAGMPQLSASPRATSFSSATYSDLARSRSLAPVHVRETVARPRITPSTRAMGFQLASQRAVKIFVEHEGWYRITQPQLVAAGLSPNTEAANLHLFAEGVEQPIRVTGAESHFGANAAIEFYGTAIDTPYTGQRAYWLVANDRPARRIESGFAGGTPGPAAQSFMQTIELKPRTTYFAALLKENTDNFFGNVISPTPDSETVSISNAVAGEGQLEVALQGVTLGQQHNVTVVLNGATLGSVNFADQQQGTAKFAIPAGVLVNGTNTIMLTSQQGENDLSVLDYMNVSFPHTFVADSDLLKFTARAGQAITVGGFIRPPSRLVDITDASRPMTLSFETSGQGGAYSLSATVPVTTSGMRTLMALSDVQLGSVASMALHVPTNLHAAQAGAEAVVLAAPEFMSQVRPLAELRQTEGRRTAIVNVNDVYDEFNFGERTPYAIRDFLRTASLAWTIKPHYLVLAGDASVDPRNYLGFGFLDFVSTKVVITSELKTASDDWFSDFENTGFAKIATGRLPARTPAEMQTIVGKIVGYSKTAPGTWANQSMMVADVDDPSISFSQAALSVEKMLPSNINVTDVFAGTLGPGTAQQTLLAGVNAGKLLVNYNGHGSVEIWGSGLFNDTLASSLTNGTKLPMFVAMNCLNGFFHDVYTQSLATALMLSPNGGAVSVWASSGLTEPGPQFQMDRTFVQTLFSQPSMTVGDAVLAAKSGIADSDVRKTFILFGDPMMRLKSGMVTTVGGKPSGPGRGDTPVHAPEREPRAGREMK
jgi:uncharacterized repeat protein (TIGR01451 family)